MNERFGILKKLTILWVQVGDASVTLKQKLLQNKTYKTIWNWYFLSQKKKKRNKMDISWQARAVLVVSGLL